MEPEFLMCPYILKKDKSLQRLDHDVYAIVFWLSGMSLSKCIASNKKIADFAQTTPMCVSNSLKRLEDAGYVERPKKEDGSSRGEIRCLVSFQKSPKVTSTDVYPTSTDVSTIHPQMYTHTSTDVHNKNTNNNIEKDNSISDWQAVVLYFYEKISPETPSRLRFKKGTKEVALHLLSLHPLYEIQLKIDALAVSPEKKFAMNLTSFSTRYSAIKVTITSGVKPTKLVTGNAELDSY